MTCRLSPQERAARVQERSRLTTIHRRQARKELNRAMKGSGPLAVHRQPKMYRVLWAGCAEWDNVGRDQFREFKTKELLTEAEQVQRWNGTGWEPLLEAK